jgi:hypothetical protein
MDNIQKSQELCSFIVDANIVTGQVKWIYSSKSMRMSWIGHVACMIVILNGYKISGCMKARDHLGGLGIDEKII